VDGDSARARGRDQSGDGVHGARRLSVTSLSLTATALSSAPVIAVIDSLLNDSSSSTLE
jgi:hypothetical protein